MYNHCWQSTHRKKPVARMILAHRLNVVDLAGSERVTWRKLRDRSPKFFRMFTADVNQSYAGFDKLM